MQAEYYSKICLLLQLKFIFRLKDVLIHFPSNQKFKSGGPEDLASFWWARVCCHSLFFSGAGNSSSMLPWPPRERKIVGEIPYEPGEF